MTTVTAFRPTATTPFQFDATLDGDTYQVLVTWNLSGQRWYINIHDQNRTLVLCRALVGSPAPRALAPPPGQLRVAQMTWTPDSGGRLFFLMTDPLPASISLGSYVVVSGAVNSGTAGDGAVNGSLLIDGYTSPLLFSSLVSAQPGAIGAVGGTPVINVSTGALTWQQGIATATTAAPHGYRLGSVIRLAIDGALPAGYCGTYYCVVSGPSELRYSLATDPGGPSTQPGTYAPDVDLLAGYFASSMVYREDARQFEVRP